MASLAAKGLGSTTVTPATLEEVFDRYAQRIYRFFYGHVGNREDAEDLTSEAFVKAAKELDVNRPESSVRSWIFTVARTILADYWRRYYRYGSLRPFDNDLALPALPELGANGSSLEAEHRVAEILTALPERYRKVLQLRFLSGMTVRETAQEMEITPENVKVLQHRALGRAVALTAAEPERLMG